MRALATRMRTAARGPSARALAGTILGSAPGLALPFLVTLRFGASTLTDAFYFAYAVASFSASLCNGSVAASLLPSLALHREQGYLALRRRARVLSRQSLVVVGAFHLVVSLIALGFILANPWPEQARLLSYACLAVLLLFVLTVALSTVQVAALQALGDFFGPTASVGLRSLVPLAALAVLPATAEGLLALAALTWIGELLRVAWLHRRVTQGAAATRAGGEARRSAGAALALTADEHVWVRVGHNAISLAVLSSNPLIARAIAAHDGAGSVTLVELADRFMLIPWLALSTSVVVVAAARWSRQAARHEWALLEADYYRTRRKLLIVSLAAAVLTIAAAVATLALIGERLVGRHDELLMTMVTVLVLTGLAPTVLAILAQRFLTVVGATRRLPAVAVLGLVVNIAASAAGYLAFGLVGIMLGSGAYRLAMLAVSSRLVRRWFAAGGPTRAGKPSAPDAARAGGSPASTDPSTAGGPPSAALLVKPTT